MGWLPEDQRDTRYYLWEPKFRCKMRYGDTFTVEDLKERGIYTSGDPVEDRRMMNSTCERYLSVNDMVEYFRKGIAVGVISRDDTKTIYDYISNHINAFRREINLSFDLKSIPFDDLIILDQFASTVYEFAKHEFTRDVANNLLARRIDEIAGFSPSNILGEEKTATSVNPDTGEEEEVDPYPKRDSLEQYFVGLSRTTRRSF